VKKTSIPRNSLAHQMVRLNAWSREDAINEIAGFDGVDENEAERRFDAAKEQQINRKIGQGRRWNKAKMAFEDARFMALGIAYHKGQFLCARDLPSISGKAGWGYSIGNNSTGRAMRKIIEPLEKAGLFSELRDEGKFVGYVLTDLGRLKFTRGPTIEIKDYYGFLEQLFRFDSSLYMDIEPVYSKRMSAMVILLTDLFLTMYF
jgi:hypothetical protein